MDDLVIINKLKRSPQEGLRLLIDQYHGLVKKICCSVLAGHEQDIEEIVADTFINIWKNRSRLSHNRGSLKGLLIITARHNAINRLRQIAKGANRVEYNEFFYGEDDVLNSLLAQEDSQLLQQLLNLLPEPDKEIFIRRHYLLEPVKDIAARFKMSEKQISNHLYQTKIKLRTKLVANGIIRKEYKNG